jgi:hypothetical protein
LSLADCDVLLRRAMALDGAAAVRAQVREFMSGRATLSGAE